MDYRDILAAELPPPRDDEPAGVRQDIVDELADHLTCAYHHELIRGSDASAARARVLERFGDPAAVARRLWLDAIGGKIMAQRMLMGTCLVVTLASVTLVGVISYRSNQAQLESARAAAEAIRALQVQNANAQANQQEMVKQLRAMSEAIRSPRSFDWNPLSITVIKATPDITAVANAMVTLQEEGFVGTAPAGGTGGRSIVRRTDASGIADFGVVHPGPYSLSIQMFLGGSVSTSSHLTIEPGSQTKMQIVCPKLPLPRVPVRTRTAWPPDLATKGLVVYARFVPVPVKLHQDQLDWHFSGISHSVLLGPGASLAEVLDPQLYLWVDPSDESPWADVLETSLHKPAEPEGSLDWQQGAYQLHELLVLRPNPVSRGEARKHFEILTAAFPVPFLPQGNSKLRLIPREDPPTDEELAQGMGFQMRPLHGPSLDVTDEYVSRIAEAFVARPGATNEWTIPLPDELIESVRTKVNAAP